MKTKSGLKLNINKTIIWLLIIWFGGWDVFVPVLPKSLIFLGFYFVGFCYLLLKSLNHGLSKLDLCVLLIVFVCPLLQSVCACRYFGQPIMIGYLSLRDILLLLLAYFIAKTADPEHIIKYIWKYQLFMICFGAVLLYCFKVDDTIISRFKPAQDSIMLTGTTEGVNELRGSRLTLGQNYLTICLAYWVSIWHSIRVERKKALMNIFLILFSFIFIHKGRSALVGGVLLFFIPMLLNFNIKKLAKIITGITLCFLCIVSIPQIRDRFLVIYDLFGDTRTTGTGDFSGVARLSEITLAAPLIADHPILGVGNLSYHYNNGFLGYFGEHFYIGDIGIVGLLLVGGIFWYICYILLFSNIYKYSRYIGDPVKIMMFSLCIFCIFSPFMGGNALWGTPKLTMWLLAFAIYGSTYRKSKTYER